MRCDHSLTAFVFLIFSSLISLSVLRVWWEAANSASGMGEGRTSQRRTVLQPLGVLVRGEAIATMIPPGPPLSNCADHIKPANYTHIGGKNADRRKAVATSGGQLHDRRSS